MDVLIPRKPKMGPERIFPNPNEDQGDQRAPEGLQEIVGNLSGEEEDEEQQHHEDDEDENEGSYFYQPLNQDPEHGGYGHLSHHEQETGGHYSHLESIEDGLDHPEEPCANIEERLQEMRLHLPDPPEDSDDDEDALGAASPNSQTSIPMDPAHVELVKRTMAGIKLPSLGVPPWAAQISDEQWKDMVELTLQSRVNTAGAAVVWD